MHQASLARAFASGASDEIRAALGAIDDLDGRLDALVASARAAWPRVHVQEQDFLRWCGARVPASASAWLDQVHAPDLFLAYACLQRDPVALEAFDRTHMTAVRRLLAKMVPSSALADDVAQILTQQLLASSPERPAALAQYNGLGRLSGWLRVCAVREAVRARRKAGIE